MVEGASDTDPPILNVTWLYHAVSYSGSHIQILSAKSWTISVFAHFSDIYLSDIYKQIRPHRFGGEGVLIGGQTATLNA